MSDKSFELRLQLPPTMRSLVAPKKCSPAEYDVIQAPTPNITKPEHVLLRMRAACIITGDTQFAAGMSDFIFKPEYPLPLGIQGSGIVVAVGSAVKNLRVGDAVYGFYMNKPLTKAPMEGFASDYALAEERFLQIKPAHISFEEAASLPGLAVTALQTIRRGLQLRGEESLKGKRVYIPGALSASGSLAIQVARNVFGAENIVSTVSTPKMNLVEEYLPGMVNQLVDYQKQDVREFIGRGAVDFAFNTQWSTFNDSVALLDPRTGTLMSIASIPPSSVMREMLGSLMPTWLGWLLDAAQLWYRWKLLGTNIKYEFVSGNPAIQEDMAEVRKLVDEGKIRGVMTVVELEDVEEVRRACGRVASGKGGLGRLIIRISNE